MQSAETAEPLSASLSAVREACNLLKGPDEASLAASSRALERAVLDLHDCRSGIRAGVRDAGVLAQLRKLRTELRQAGRLLESAADFYWGWEHMLGTVSAGYTAEGEPEPVVRPGKLHCQG
jgi:hypothetical protein